MATIHYEGLDGWWKSAAFWGLLGGWFVLTKSPPLPWAILAVTAGAATGATSAFWLSKMKTRPMSVTGWAGLLVFAGLIYSLTTSNPTVRVPTMGYFALGCLFQSANMLVFGIAGTRALKSVNAKNANWLAKLDPPIQRTGPPPPSDAADCAEALIAALPEPLASEIRPSLRTVTVATPFRSLDSISPAASFLAGNPLLTPGTVWPSRGGKPLEFLAQLNLAELPATDHPRPASGLLAFFYDARESPWGHDAGDRDGTAVLFSADPQAAIPGMKPGGPAHPPPRQPLAFLQTRSLDLSSEQRDRIDDCIEQADDSGAERISHLYYTLQEAESPGPHRVLSPPAPVQDDMDDDLKAAASFLGLPAETTWTMLLQLDSDRDLNWCWGDAGCLYFWIPADDLAAGRFDRVWTILQCC